MSESRWQQIERVYQTALKLGADQREAFLEETCRDAPALRRDVEALLAAPSLPLMNRPAWEAVAMSAAGLVREGETVGAYRIGTLLGKGGMGEVYRAHDTKLRRDVAFKVLPSAFVNDLDRLSRFQREARVLASLNHPNIAAIYGLEDSGSIHALVMELVEGPTLAERIRRGAIPLNEALPIAKQICDALEYAHEQGVVHRDLKPANIKVTPSGAVKVLDFGLAKVLESGAASTDISDSPTITQAATQPGILFGTPAYMSPEQANGKTVERRTDIWAFGCVLFEMLTGKIAFRGETVTETLAAVMSAQPDWSALPATTPQPVRALLRRCLQREARQRLQAIGEARIALEEIVSGGAPSEPPLNRTRPWKMGFAAAIAATFIAAAAGFVVWNLKPAPANPSVLTRFTITLPPGQELAAPSYPVLALSPDASHLAYVATQRGVQQIYLRAMDRGDASPISGTEGGADPFFSPDGQWLGFIADGKLKKISIRGGVAQDLTPVGLYDSGASWVSEHTIAFAPYSSVLHQVSDEGGSPQPMTRFEKGETLHMWPQVLPSSKAVLFTVATAGPTAIAVQQIGGERRNLIQGQGASRASYVSGRLIYAQAGNLMAVPFDLDRLQIRKGAVPASVVSNVMQWPTNGAAQYSVSATGSLVYVSGSAPQRNSELVWVDRKDQKERSLGAPARSYNQPRLSPDGTRLAVDVVEAAEKMQVWQWDLARGGPLTPFTFDSVNRHAVWTPDSKRLVFMSNREGPTQIFWQLADGSGELHRLTHNRLTAAGDILYIPYSVSNELLTFIKLVRPTEAELWMLPLDPSAGSYGQEQRLPIQRAVLDGGPQFSPDGRWLAYASEESGQRQIYVQAFPGPGGKQQISTDGGNEPQWNSNGRELFYRSGDKMMAVDISPQGSAGKSHVLFQGPYLTANGGWVRPNYDVSADGQRFLMMKPVGKAQTPVTEINVVLNWSEELKRLVPAETK